MFASLTCISFDTKTNRMRLQTLSLMSEVVVCETTFPTSRVQIIEERRKGLPTFYVTFNGLFELFAEKDVVKNSKNMNYQKRTIKEWENRARDGQTYRL